MSRRVRRALAAVFLATGAATALSACATDGTTGGPPSAGPVVGREAERRAVYADAVAQARRLEADGRLGDALLRWRAAEAVEPTDPTAGRQAARVQALVSTRVAALKAQGAAAKSRGEAVAARTAYEDVLDLAPGDADATAALKSIETAATLQSIAKGGAGGPGMEGSKRGAASKGKGKAKTRKKGG